MRLSEEANKILEEFAVERENNPNVRSEGISERVLGARIRAYLNNPMYAVWELRQKGLASKVGNRVILTQEGWRHIDRHIRPPYSRKGSFFRKHQALIVGIATVVCAIVGILALLNQCG